MMMMMIFSHKNRSLSVIISITKLQQRIMHYVDIIYISKYSNMPHMAFKDIYKQFTYLTYLD